jgi:hypothetical protein
MKIQAGLILLLASYLLVAGSAHAVIPGGEPVAFELQVLRGREVAWLRKASLQRSDDLYGPFVYSLPGGKVTGPLAGNSALPQCFMRFVPPAEAGTQ